MTSPPPKKIPGSSRRGNHSQSANVAANGATVAMVDGHGNTLISRFLNDETAIERYPRLKPEHFASPVQAQIFEAILLLHDDGHDTNFVAVEDYFRRRGKLQEIGEHTLTTLAADSRIAAMDDGCFDYALDCVLDAYRKREEMRIFKDGAAGQINAEQAAEKLAELIAPPRDLPQIDDGAELISKPIILPDDVIEGIVHHGGKEVVGGASKAYKTWFLTDTGVSVATGTDWLGKFPTKRGRVLFINLEIQEGFFAKRIKAICDERQLTLEAGYFDVWNLRGCAADISTLLPRMLRRIGRNHYALIIIDPIYKLLGARDENSAGDIATLLNEIEKLAVATGAAVAFGAHYSKGNQASKESIDRVGGSGVFARDPDTILNFTRHEEADCFTVDAILRNHPPIEPFVVRWEYPLFSVDGTLDPARLKQAGRKEQYHAKDVLALIDEPMSATEIVKEAYQELQIPRRRVFELLADLKRGGLLKQPQKRGKYEPV